MKYKEISFTNQVLRYKNFIDQGKETTVFEIKSAPTMQVGHGKFP